MNAHTPGPWSILAGFIDARRPDGGLREENSTINDEGQREFNSVACVFGPQQDANARLIAAAPDLLAALEVIEHYGISGLDGDAHAALEDMLPIIQAAIAKATQS
jgi:hypothetical protein